MRVKKKQRSHGFLGDHIFHKLFAFAAMKCEDSEVNPKSSKFVNRELTVSAVATVNCSYQRRMVGLLIDP